MNLALEDPLPELITFATDIPLSFYIINGLAILGLLFLSGIISGSEVAFFSLSSEQVQHARASERKSDQLISKLISAPRRLLATILILNNLVNILIITLSTYVTWEIVGGGDDSEGFILVVLTTVVTILIIFIGEIVPKVYASQHNHGFATMTSGFLSFSTKVFHPLSWVLISTSQLIESRIQRKGYNLSVDELHQALEITVTHESTSEEREMLKGIVNFSTLSVKQVMRSRIDIKAVDVETDFHELMDMVNKTGYSRIPVYSETIDNIEGILYIKDLLPHLEKDESFAWTSLLRPGFFVPESKKIDGLLKDFQEKQVHMAIVIDEYGGTSGLITLEDVIEEIVGEINDEFDDDQDITFNKIDKQTYIFEGKTSLNDFCKIVGVDSNLFDKVKGESESLGGLILELHTKLPKTGEKIYFSPFVFTVVAVDQKRIKKIRVFIEQVMDPLKKEFED